MAWCDGIMLMVMMAVIDDGRVIFGIPPLANLHFRLALMTDQLTCDRTVTLILLAMPTDSSTSFSLRLWSHKTEDSPFCSVVFFNNDGFSSFIGKSNLMDAVSFVLGEKTANLRVRSLKVSQG